jgi:hypothetical protein
VQVTGGCSISTQPGAAPRHLSCTLWCKDAVLTVSGTDPTSTHGPCMILLVSCVSHDGSPMCNTLKCRSLCYSHQVSIGCIGKATCNGRLNASLHAVEALWCALPCGTKQAWLGQTHKQSMPCQAHGAGLCNLQGTQRLWSTTSPLWLGLFNWHCST